MSAPRGDTVRIGTKSVLFGAHQFLLHPLLLAMGWWQEYGWGRVEIGFTTGLAACEDCIGAHPAEYPIYASLRDPRLWLAFLVHDLGYLGKPNMDGPEGETHPELGARIMRRMFGDAWGDFVLLHSRYYAKRLGRPVSPLCHADKRVIVLEPSWLYLPRVWVSGELREYVANAQRRAATTTGPSDQLTAEERAAMASGNPWRWHRALRSYMRRWIEEHRGGKADQWTRLRHRVTS